MHGLEGCSNQSSVLCQPFTLSPEPNLVYWVLGELLCSHPHVEEWCFSQAKWFLPYRITLVWGSVLNISITNLWFGSISHHALLLCNETTTRVWILSILSKTHTMIGKIHWFFIWFLLRTQLNLKWILVFFQRIFDPSKTCESRAFFFFFFFFSEDTESCSVAQSGLRPFTWSLEPNLINWVLGELSRVLIICKFFLFKHYS